ncbi:MAG: ABC transporter ATP-binding protein [Bacteroidota bacterium]|nr:ABC transporter ATP-binding protein [Bacteroidota bacterium]
MRELRKLNQYLWRHRYMLLTGTIFVAMANMLKVFNPKIVGWAVDIVYATFNAEDMNSVEGPLGIQLNVAPNAGLIILACTFIGLALISGLFTFIMRQTIIVASRRIEYDLKNDIYAQYQRLDQAFYKKNNTGDLMSRATEDVSRVRMYLGPALMYGINLFFLITFVLLSMVQIDPVLTAWVLIPLPFLSLSIYYVNDKINRGSEAIQRQLSFLTTSAQEFFSGIRVIKSYAQEEMAIYQYANDSEEYKQRSIHLAKIESIFLPLMVLMIGLSTLLVIYIGGLRIIDGAITPGNMAEFIIYVNLLTWPVTSIGWVASIIQRAAASQKRINEFLSAEPQVSTPQEGQKPSKTGLIEFKDVSFVYPETGIQALNKVNLAIKSGERIAVIGRTGSGKSSLAELMMRMYDPKEGQITYNGVDLKDLDLHAWRQTIGYVPQDVFLFSETIKDNIQFSPGDKQNEGKMAPQIAAQHASIHEEITSFYDGYETLVGERGVTLSGGQKQRISLARALVNSPSILLLDDSLSAVDAETESRILGYLDSLDKETTAIIITHRIFSLLDFDKIIVLDQGSVIQRGNHEELYKQEGFYREIYDKQRPQ